MNRDRIDAAVHAQIDRRLYLLRDVERSGGVDRWSHLKTHGHYMPTILSAVREGYLLPRPSFVYEITDAGRRYLAEIEAAKLRA